MEQEEIVVPETTEEVTPEVTTEEESIDDVKARLVKAEEIAENQRIRAEKAEAATRKAKEAVPVKEPESKSNLSSSDMLAVINAKVHQDDMERVEKFAAMEGVSVKDALSNPELKAILDLRGEQRSTAAAANVTNVRRGPSELSGDVLLSNASAGKLPDSDADIERLIAAKAAQK